MEITKKEIALIDEWFELHQKIEKLEDELDSLAQKLKRINNKLYSKNSKEELEEFRNFLAAEIKNSTRKLTKLKLDSYPA